MPKNYRVVHCRGAVFATFCCCALFLRAAVSGYTFRDCEMGLLMNAKGMWYDICFCVCLCGLTKITRAHKRGDSSLRFHPKMFLFKSIYICRIVRLRCVLEFFWLLFLKFRRLAKTNIVAVRAVKAETRRRQQNINWVNRIKLLSLSLYMPIVMMRLWPVLHSSKYKHNSLGPTTSTRSYYPYENDLYTKWTATANFLYTPVYFNSVTASGDKLLRLVYTTCMHLISQEPVHMFLYKLYIRTYLFFVYIWFTP